MHKILIITPLYPPDIAPSAIYIKEFARRLSTEEEITILAYGTLPEKISGVKILTVSKNMILPIRLLFFLRVLIQLAHRADYLYVQNGASVELPTLFACFFTRVPIVFHLGDTVALTASKQQWIPRTITCFLVKRATKIICKKHEDISWLPHTEKVTRIDTPVTRPEIMPFVSYPTQEFVDYEQSWNSHMKALINIFNHAKK